MKFIKDYILPKSQSMQGFFKNLRDIGIDMEYNRGIPSGVRDSNGKFYSFKKLGITPLDLQVLSEKGRFNQITHRLESLEKARSNKEQDKNFER